MAKKPPVVDIGKIDDLDVLLSHLRRDSDPANRMRIVSRIGRRKDVSPEMVTELGRMAFGETSAPVQGEYVRTIMEIGGPTAIGALRLISHRPGSVAVGQNAEYGIKALKASAARTATPEEATRRLLGILRIGGAWQDRWDALHSLTERGICQKTALEIARIAEAETAPRVQRPMVGIIVEHVGTAALPTLEKLLKSPNWIGVGEELRSEITALKGRAREQQKALRKQLPQQPKVKRVKPLTLAGA